MKWAHDSRLNNIYLKNPATELQTKNHIFSMKCIIGSLQLQHRLGLILVQLLDQDACGNMRQGRLKDDRTLRLIVRIIHFEDLMEAQLLHNARRIVAGAQHMVDGDLMLPHILIGTFRQLSGNAAAAIIAVHGKYFAIEYAILIRIQIKYVEFLL